MKQITLLLLFAFLSLFTFSNERLQTANSLYEEAKYEEAKTLYLQLLEKQEYSATVNYNLANCYFKTNQIAKAILHYERVLKAEPSHEDALYNLKMANDKTIDKIESIPDLFVYRWWKSAFNLFSSDNWAKIMMLFLAISLLLFVVYLFIDQLRIKKLSFYISTTFFILAMFCWFLASRQNNYLNKTQYAVIIEPTVNINSSPSEGSSKLFVLHEGTKVKVKKQSNDWYNISLPNGNSGWISSNKLEGI